MDSVARVFEDGDGCGVVDVFQRDPVDTEHSVVYSKSRMKTRH